MPPNDEKKYRIHFANSESHAPVDIDPESSLSEVLDATNSPVLFGCRTGICATCLIRLLEGEENVEPPDEDEQEVLEAVADDEPKARLACQLQVKGDIKIEYIGK